MRSDNANYTARNIEPSKDPRYTVELAFDFDNTDLHYFTSHADAQIPVAATSTASSIATGGISGTSQKIKPDKGLASIGNIRVKLVDDGEVISDLFNTKLDIGEGLRGKRVRVYTSFVDEVWNDYVLVQTQIIDRVNYLNGIYTLDCSDIQRSERKDIFDLAKTTLSSAMTETLLLVPVYSVTGFETLQHGTSYSDATSDFTSSPQDIRTVLYVKVEDEIIRCTGTTTDATYGLSFVVDSDNASPQNTGRGALNTRAAAHNVDNTLTDNDRKTKVQEYVYLQMPIPKLIYAILTGNLEGQSGEVLPTKWHLNIDTSFVRLADFTGIGSDWWDTTDDTAGVVGNFLGLKKQDGKKFIETQLNLLLGAYNPIYSDGALGLKRMTNILSGAGYIRELNESNVISVSSLDHDMRSVQNIYQIEWNWDDTQEKYTRTTLMIDQASINKHGDARLTNLSFRGLDGDRHTEETVFNLFNSLRDRYSGPPLKLRVSCLPRLNVLEVGDIVNVNLSTVRDFNGTLKPLDRPFEVQGVSINWLTGIVSLDLFGSSQAAGGLALGTASSVLNDSFYTSSGTELSAFINGLTSPNGGAHTITGGVLHITADITLPGSTPATVYYYDGPVTIDDPNTVTITNNIELRVKGHLTINGIISGAGQGHAGVASNASQYPPTLSGTEGYLSSTQPGGGVKWSIEFLGANNGVTSNEALTTAGIADQLEYFTLINDTTTDTLSGVPTDLRGSSGAGGGNAAAFFNGTTTLILGVGGNGGASGAGLITITRGASFGTSGNVDLSGGNGSAGTNWSAVNLASGGGAGGGPGCWLILLDGATVAIPNTTSTEFIANQGDTPIAGTPISSPFLWTDDITIALGFKQLRSSFYIGSGATGRDRNTAANRIQFIPEYIAAEIDPPLLTVVAPTSLVLKSGDNDLLKATDGTIISRINTSWTASTDQNLGGYEVEFKLSAESNWLPASNTVNLEITQIYIAPIQDGVNYDVRVRAINNIGIRSDWLTQSNYTTIGKLNPPPDCDSFLVQRLADGTRVFDGGLLSSNLPVDFAGYVIRAATGNGLAWSALTALHVGVITELPYETNQLAAGTYTAGIKAIDTTGNESTNAVLVDSTLGDPRISNAITTVDFKLDGFPDTKTNCWVDPITGNLIATDQYTWANFATGSPIQTWADWTTWATNPNSPITYESTAIDLGVVTTFTPLVTVTSNGTTVTLQEAHSDDDITYSTYATSGSQVSGRYVKIKITIANATELIRVTQALVIIDADIVQETIEDLDTSTVDTGSPRVAGDIRLPVVKTYTQIKSVQLALQNVGAGWTWELIDKTVTGPRIKIYNASSVLSDATIDAIIVGA